ncbi:GNAT family N-acetyltransferase [Achromobacter spanius]|uniref:GNAT family N-acetyltransferase n=3 Tax=Achromobacter TaxID=222 RepID=A0ABY8H028_9BURK|nr:MULTISPECIES: GNAT family N-acetyltransferase [Achromobacter]WAI86133.1 GNAT family N-acetyltransferase [Achromobacter spanius]WEX96214.1 GNAT family N-acetyltransferase [Achromobacter sp. SS2-2022]WFP10068.1 GNAT family N-acetyltransferase [Achromobacter spanius]
MSSAGFPDVFLTPRLRAQRMSQAHLPFIEKMHANADVMATMGGTRDAAASRLYLAQNEAHWMDHGYGMYVLEDREMGRLAGRAGLKYTVSDEQGAIELAYAFEPECWGRGYAMEISGALITLGFKLLPVDVLCGVAIQSNTASRRVLEKSGMRYVSKAAGNGDTVKVRYEIRRADWRVLQDPAHDDTRPARQGLADDNTRQPRR